VVVCGWEAGAVMQTTTVKTLKELSDIIPEGCNQIAAVYKYGEWEVSFVYRPMLKR
jgi:hypothetical protein